ncbi:MAG: TraR/DksA C4-type zinc finger protein [Kiritimatiellae bacterium]|nr:TraR/DksA C4-type zinc finger protein [Kiritimatiellia bacterium]
MATAKKKAAEAKSVSAKKPAAAKAPAGKKSAASKSKVSEKASSNEEKVEKKSPPKMKKMVVKAPSTPLQEEIFENDSKDFAFAFAASMMKEQKAADARQSEANASNSIKLTKRPTTRARGEDTLKFSDSDLAQFRKSLIALRQSIVGKTATLKTNALEQTIDRAGEDEDGSDSFMRLQNLGQVGEQNKTLQKIDEALHRIDDGTYGICEMCGQLIRKARLQHLPFAHTCMECQSEVEANRDLRG